MAVLSEQRIVNSDDFARVHAFLLASSGLPPALYPRLFRKLADEVFDAGNFFAIEPCEGGRQRRLVLQAESLAAGSNVFLIDHAWSFRLPDAVKHLKEVPGLAERMAALMCVDLDADQEHGGAGAEDQDDENWSANRVLEVVEKEADRLKERGDSSAWLELDELGINDEMLACLDLSSKFQNLVALNLWGNKLEDADKLLTEITKCRRLKALWLNDNPVLSSSVDVAKAFVDGLPELEIYNSCFTSKAGRWALGFCSGLINENNCTVSSSVPLEHITSLDLSVRGMHKLPEAFLPAELPLLAQLNLRGNPLEQHSSDDLLKLLSRFPNLHRLEVDVPGALGNSAISIIEYLPSISMLNGVSASSIVESGKHVIDSVLEPRLPEWSTTEPLADRVISAMWQYLMTYRLADEQKIDETPVWYVMDEVGSALRHSDDANFRLSPFLYMPDGKLSSAVSYSILWPVRTVNKGDECTRDFLFGIGEDKQRSARLTAWFRTPVNYFIREFSKYHELLSTTNPLIPENEASSTKSIVLNDKSVLKVFTDIPQVEENLSRPEFVLTNEAKDADIIWTSLQVDSELKTALGLTEHQYTNQFPYEACLVMKHHLAETIHKAQGSPEWLQPTYNLENQLSQFIGDYYVRKQEGSDNLWILKPWNMARTIDTTVTGDISAIIRLMETGPKICQKYIHQPALFQGKKFDLRYIVLVRSMKPLEIFLSDVFWVRLANNNYTLERNSLFEYETHFTVMNYIGKLNHIYTPEFIREFELEHQVKWADIHQRVRQMIRRVFESAVAVHPEMQSPMSRAIYGVDVMLDHQFMPKILEVTYCPDCTRACKYDTEAFTGGIVRASEFFNTVFGCLFLGESKHVTPL